MNGIEAINMLKLIQTNMLINKLEKFTTTETNANTATNTATNTGTNTGTAVTNNKLETTSTTNIKDTMDTLKWVFIGIGVFLGLLLIIGIIYWIYSYFSSPSHIDILENKYLSEKSIPQTQSTNNNYLKSNIGFIDTSNKSIPETTSVYDKLDTLPDSNISFDTLPNDTYPDDTLPNDTYPDDTLPNDTYPDDTLDIENNDSIDENEFMSKDGDNYNSEKNASLRITYDKLPKKDTYGGQKRGNMRSNKAKFSKK